MKTELKAAPLRLSSGAWLMLAAFFYAAIYLFFYPPVYLFRDESDYLAMAYVLRKGTLFLDHLDIPVRSFIFAQGHRVSDYFPGNSMLLLPFTLAGWKAVFLSGLFFHLLGFFFFSKLLKLFDLKNPLYTVLYLCFPAFVFYSRTIMSDLPCAALFLGGVYFYFKNKEAWGRAGFFWGLSLLVRQTNAVALWPFLAGALAVSIKEKNAQGILKLFCGIAPWIVLILTLNAICYGAPFAVGYARSAFSVNDFLPQYVPAHLKHYFMSLSLVYPFMLASPLLAMRTRKWESVCAFLSLLLFYSAYFFRDKFPGRGMDLFFSTRFLFPVIPLLLLSYAEVLDAFLNRLSAKLYRPFILTIIVALASGTAAISWKHQQLLQTQDVLRGALYSFSEKDSAVIYDRNTAELIQKAWGERQYVPYSDIEHLLAFLETADFTKGVYFASRNEWYDGNYLTGPSAGDIAALEKKYRVTKLFDQNDFRILKIEHA